AVEEGVGASGLALAPPLLPKTECLVGERVDRVEVEHADRLEDVRDVPRVEPRSALALDLIDPGGWDDEERGLARTAELADLAEPVLRLLVVALPVQDLEQVAEVVGEEAEDDELGPDAVGVLPQGEVLLLGRVAKVAGVEDLGADPQALGKPLLEALGG